MINASCCVAGAWRSTAMQGSSSRLPSPHSAAQAAHRYHHTTCPFPLSSPPLPMKLCRMSKAERVWCSNAPPASNRDTYCSAMPLRIRNNGGEWASGGWRHVGYM